MTIHKIFHTYPCVHIHINCNLTATLTLPISDINDCDPNPCENEGTCDDLVNGYHCQCVVGYTGATCQTSTLITVVI